MWANYASAPHLACNEKSLTTTKTINEQNTHWGNELKLKFVFVKQTKQHIQKNKQVAKVFDPSTFKKRTANVNSNS